MARRTSPPGGTRHTWIRRRPSRYVGAKQQHAQLKDVPFFTGVEVGFTRHLARDPFGLGPLAGGVMTSGGALATLHRLAVARNKVIGSTRNGLAGRVARRVVFASEHDHTSIGEAAMFLGLGTGAVVGVPADGHCRMRADALRREVSASPDRGERPFAVVAAAGATDTAAVDPLGPLAEIASEHKLWFHVDAIYGGAVRVSARRRDILAGVELAESAGFDPYKWWYLARTYSLALFRDLPRMIGASRVAAPCMSDSGPATNLGEISVEGWRPAEVLKLHPTLQHLGRFGLEALIEHSFVLTRNFTAAWRRRPHIKLASDPDLNIVCLRLRPPVYPEAHLDAMQTALRKNPQESGLTLSLTIFRGGRW